MIAFMALALVLPMAVIAPARPGTPVSNRIALLETREFSLGDPVQEADLTPMQREIKAVLDTMRIRREAVVAEAATGTARPAALQRLQWETRLQVLRIQEKYARQEGRLDLARRLQEGIKVLQRERVAATINVR